MFTRPNILRRRGETPAAYCHDCGGAVAATAELSFGWEWNGARDAAWTAAKDTGALSLMSYDSSQMLGTVYGQQQTVDAQATAYISNVYRAGSAVAGGRKLSDLSASDLDGMILATQQNAADIALLRDLCKSLNVIYKDTDGQP